MTAVTWFDASTNHRHSAFLIPHFTFRIPHFTQYLSGVGRVGGDFSRTPQYTIAVFKWRPAISGIP